MSVPPRSTGAGTVDCSIPLWQATDPYVNLETAAAMIQGYYRETGSFDEAVGKYHAPNNPQSAERYKSRVRQRLALVESGRR